MQAKGTPLKNAQTPGQLLKLKMIQQRYEQHNIKHLASDSEIRGVQGGRKLGMSPSYPQLQIYNQEDFAMPMAAQDGDYVSISNIDRNLTENKEESGDYDGETESCGHKISAG